MKNTIFNMFIFMSMIWSGRFGQAKKATDRATCYACNTYMDGSGDSKCLVKDPNGVVECDAVPSYGDCLTMRVSETLSNGITRENGEKGCIYPQHLMCFEHATGEKLVLGECLRVHMTRYSFNAWDECFQGKVARTFEREHQDHGNVSHPHHGLDIHLRGSVRRRQHHRRLAPRQNRQVYGNNSSRHNNVTGYSIPRLSSKPKVEDRYFEYCICKGSLCNQKDKLKLHGLDDTKSLATNISSKFTQNFTVLLLLLLLLIK